MRRKTTQIKNNDVTKNFIRKNRTYFEHNIQITKKLINSIEHSNYTISTFIAKQWIYDVLMNQLQTQLDKVQMRKIVDQTMKQCTNLFNHENWQVNPIGPFNQGNKQIELIADQEPKVQKFDPTLGFSKSSKYKQNKIHTQTSRSSSRYKTNNCSKDLHASALKPSSKNSSRSSKLVQSKRTSQILKLVPLRLQNQNIFTPEQNNGFRRNIQDFLRDKKLNIVNNNNLNKQQFNSSMNNLGQKIKFFFDQKQPQLKTIHQLEKTSQFLKTSKNLLAVQFNSSSLQFSNSQMIKIPPSYLTSREQCATDQNGEKISLINRKSGKNGKKNIQILKMKCKVMLNEAIEQEINKSKQAVKRLQKARIQTIRLKPLSKNKILKDVQNLNDEDIRSLQLSHRIHTDQAYTLQQLKQKVEHNLLTNRVNFKQLKQNEGFGKVFELQIKRIQQEQSLKKELRKKNEKEITRQKQQKIEFLESTGKQNKIFNQNVVLFETNQKPNFLRQNKKRTLLIPTLLTQS